MAVAIALDGAAEDGRGELEPGVLLDVGLDRREPSAGVLVGRGRLGGVAHRVQAFLELPDFPVQGVAFRALGLDAAGSAPGSAEGSPSASIPSASSASSSTPAPAPRSRRSASILRRSFASAGGGLGPGEFVDRGATGFADEGVEQGLAVADDGLGRLEAAPLGNRGATRRAARRDLVALGIGQGVDDRLGDGRRLPLAARPADAAGERGDVLGEEGGLAVDLLDLAAESAGLVQPIEQVVEPLQAVARDLGRGVAARARAGRPPRPIGPARRRGATRRRPGSCGPGPAPRAASPRSIAVRARASRVASPAFRRGLADGPEGLAERRRGPRRRPPRQPRPRASPSGSASASVISSRYETDQARISAGEPGVDPGRSPEPIPFLADSRRAPQRPRSRAASRPAVASTSRRRLAFERGEPRDAVGLAAEAPWSTSSSTCAPTGVGGAAQFAWDSAWRRDVGITAATRACDDLIRRGRLESPIQRRLAISYRC